MDIRMIRVGALAFTAVALSYTTGCVGTAAVTWNKPTPGRSLGKTVFLAPASADTIENRCVGRHTWTLFAIPGKRIVSSGATVDKRVGAAVADALTAAGYDVKSSAQAPTPATVVITPLVNRFHYWSYSWAWPFMFQGGGIGIELEAAPRDGGRPVFSKDYDSGDAFWFTFGGSWGFGDSIRDDMSGIVRGVRDQAATPAFAEVAACVPPPGGFLTPTRSEGDTAKRLLTLKTLRDDGILTEAEYQAKAAELKKQL